MNLSDYLNLPLEERKRHIDLSTPCSLVTLSKWSRSKQETCDFHEIDNDVEDWRSGHIHRCHLCQCSTTKGSVCMNPLHFYFGTPSENRLDIPPEIRSEVTSGPKSEGHKENIRKAALNRPPVTEETRRKHSASRTGLVQSEQTKQKRSESIRQWWKQRKQNASSS